MGENSWLDDSTYISFSTLKRTGEWVDTPVWFAPGADCFYIFSAGGAGKVKRLRNFSACRVAPCTFSGTLLDEYRTGSAWLIDDPAGQQFALQALRRKYGPQMWAADIGAKLSGRFSRRQYIGFRLD
ncbi:hypothetical protein [Haliea sp. E17]|uniref:hypothetical protein n=1 Tax=Haliea sp. E17 TaxID=3401576 RepID=UPI003AAABD67